MDEQKQEQKNYPDETPSGIPLEALRAKSEGTAQEKEEYMFFNVMPKVKVEEKLVEPSIKISESDVKKEAKTESAFILVVQKYKKIIIISVASIILGLAGYFAYYKLVVQKQKETEAMLNNLAFVNKKAANIPNPENQSKSEDAAAKSTTPKEWQLKYFNNEACQDMATCGDNADPDHDGLVNIDEFKLGTDPNNPDSDQDGLSDGDEAHVFGTSPLNSHTAGDPKYSDADFIKGGYDINHPDKKFTDDQIKDLGNLMTEKGLHPPTLETLQSVLNSVYHFGEIQPGATSSLDSIKTSTTSQQTNLDSFDQSVEAKQDRDTQRSLAIKNIGIALIKYYADNKSYPKTGIFSEMVDSVKLYFKTAVNPKDPINIDPYVYSYAPNPDASDYLLSFYSEVAGQLIKKHASDALKDKSVEEAAIFDDQRKADLESLQTALLLYSNKNVAGDQAYVFPTVEKYKSAIMPAYITAIPKDPKTGADYEYKVSGTFSTFTLKAILDNPKPGTTGYLCNQEECREY